MKNIILLGTSRAGKTTFSKMLLAEYPNCCLIEGDVLRAAYKKVIVKDKNIAVDEIGKTPEYREFLENVYYYSAKYNSEIMYVLDTVDLLPEHAYKFPDAIVLVFGYPNIELSELLPIWKNDQTNGHLKNYSDDRLEQKAKKWIKKSKELEKDAQKYNLKFIDTSVNREKTLNDLLEYIIEQIG